jgi:ABC-type glycerol-3-phosphate transport system substrate-binding protein
MAKTVRKCGLILMMLLLCSFLSFAEGTQEEGAEAAAKAQTLRIEADSWILQKFPVREAAERFMEDHPNVEVKVSPKNYRNFVQTYLMVWKADKTTTDLAIGGMPNELSDLVAPGLLADLSGLLEGQMAKDNFIPGFLYSGRFEDENGNPFFPVLPFMGEVMALNVNKNMYRDAGLTQNGQPRAAADWNEFEQQLNALQQVAPSNALSVSWGWNFITYSYAGGLLAMRGDIYEEDGKTLDFSSEEARQWLEMNQRWVEQGLAAKGTISDVNYGRNNFKAETIAEIYTAHSRTIGAANVLGEDATTVLPVPGANENGTIAFSHCVYIPKVSPNQELAKQFVKEQIFSKWFQQKGFNDYGKLPVIKDYYAGLAWFQDAADRILAMAEKSQYFPKYVEGTKLRDVMLEEMHPAISGDQSAEQALQNIRNKIDERDIDLTRLGYTE